MTVVEIAKNRWAVKDDDGSFLGEVYPSRSEAIKHANRIKGLRPGVREEMKRTKTLTAHTEYMNGLSATMETMRKELK